MVEGESGQGWSQIGGQNFDDCLVEDAAAIVNLPAATVVGCCCCFGGEGFADLMVVQRGREEKGRKVTVMMVTVDSGGGGCDVMLLDVSSAVIRKDIVKLLDFIEKLNDGCVQIPVRCNAESMSCISIAIHDLVQSIFRWSGVHMLIKLKHHDVLQLLENIKSYISSHSYAESSHMTMTEDRLVELLDVIIMYLQYLPKCCSKLFLPSMTQYEVLQNVCGTVRDFHGLKINGCVEYETIEFVLPQLQLLAQRVVNFYLTLFDYHLEERDKSEEIDESDISQFNSKLDNLLVEIAPVVLEHMINAITPSTSARNIHVMIEFQLIILTDVPKDVIHHDKLFILLARVGALIKEVSILVRNLENSMDEDNMHEINCANQDFLENIELLKEDLKHVFLKAATNSSLLFFPTSDGPCFDKGRNWSGERRPRNYKIVLGKVEQELHRDIWARVLDVAYVVEHAINSILARDHGLLQFIVLLPDIVENIKLVKKEVQEKISKKTNVIFTNSPNKPDENKSSIAGTIIVGFEEETKWIIRKLTSGPSEVDVISIIGMLGLGKTTLAYRVYNDNSVVGQYELRPRNIHVVIEFLLIILTDVPKDVIRHDKLFVLLERVGSHTKEVSIIVHNLEENIKETSSASLNLLENVELLRKDLKNVFLKAPADSSQLCFPMSDGPLFMTLLLRNLNDLLNSNAYSVALIKEEISRVKENLEHIRSFFGNVEQELHKDLWTCVLDVAYETEHAINLILARDRGLLQLIFLFHETVGKIKLVKMSIIFANSPNKPVINKSSIASKIIVAFEEETEWIIRKLTSGPAEVDVISIVGMPGLGKTTLAYSVYTEKSVVGYFDIRAWYTVDQERNEKKLLQKIFSEVIGLKERVSEDDIDDDIADKLRRQLFGKRYLIVLDDLWYTATWDELTSPFPTEYHKGSRVILTSRKKEVALPGKCHRSS
ncbi:hypothetical protein BC332_13881 [Capsicum chinense]|nr:hypothetical protein BC332_13881 [Capsicum chinense]